MKTPEELAEDIFGFKLAQEKYIIAEAIRQRDAEVLEFAKSCTVLSDFVILLSSELKRERDGK